MLFAVAAEIDRQLCLARLREQLDLAEAVIASVERADALVEEAMQRLDAFLDHVAAMRVAVGGERLEFLAIGADPDADLDPAAAEMVERRDLLRHHDDVA